MKRVTRSIPVLERHQGITPEFSHATAGCLRPSGFFLHTRTTRSRRDCEEEDEKEEKHLDGTLPMIIISFVAYVSLIATVFNAYSSISLLVPAFRHHLSSRSVTETSHSCNLSHLRHQTQDYANLDAMYAPSTTHAPNVIVNARRFMLRYFSTPSPSYLVTLLHNICVLCTRGITV